MDKMAVYLEEDTALALEELASAQGRSPSELVREALSLYVSERERPLPKGIGRFRSGRSDVSERAEELLFSGIRERS